jgi:ferredoxin-NADP reductase
MTEVGVEPKVKTRQIYKMRVSEIRDYTPCIRELFVSCIDPHEFAFRAGQFVMLHVPNPLDIAGKPILRAYSIASSDEQKNGFRLVFKFVDEGVASKFVWGLKGNEILNFTGPFGRVYFKEPPTEQVVFLNTGSGISQHFSFIESNYKKHPNLKYRLLFGLRYETDIYYQSELERLKALVKDFSYEYILSRPTSKWSGKSGYVQNYVNDFTAEGLPTTFYLCGNGQMIKDTKVLLAAAGIEPSSILAEAFD